MDRDPGGQKHTDPTDPDQQHCFPQGARQETPDKLRKVTMPISGPGQSVDRTRNRRRAAHLYGCARAGSGWTRG
jgi:hypothetical protein